MISRMTTLARPYALAAFEYAEQRNELNEWESMLNSAAEIAKNKETVRLIDSPLLTPVQLEKLFEEILAPLSDEHRKNFIHLLADKKRLGLLPAIAELFKELKLASEKILNVTLITAIGLDETMKNKVTEALIKRLKKKILLEHYVDSSLLGGAIVRTEDKVLDASVQGKLNRLLNSLSV